MKEKVFTYRVVEVTKRKLEDDGETITEMTHYELYEKVPWILGSWERRGVGICGDKEFNSVEEAKAYALYLVQNWIKWSEWEEKAKEKKEILKTTVKIAFEGNIDVKNPNEWKK